MSQVRYHYTFAAHEDEAELCALEQRRLFGGEAGPYGLISCTGIEASRSPFIKTRLRVDLTAEDLRSLTDAVGEMEPCGGTFKVVCLKNGSSLSYEDLRSAERMLGG